MKTQVAELDLFYLSYDEPNCEEHWADILNKVPWAKRVHGVKGFDAAHKECARQSDTDRFITIDADNIVNEDFFDQELIMPESDSIYSWNAKNMLNGLCYGNGGVKCLSLIHISEPTRRYAISYAVFCLVMGFHIQHILLGPAFYSTIAIA